MKRNEIMGTTSLKALGIVVALGVVARAGLPYLPLAGPPPLRMLSVKNPQAAAVIPLATGKPPFATNTLPNLEAAVPGAARTNVAFAGLTNSVSTESLISAGYDNPLADPRTAAIFAMPTPDLLSITPQMLATYFHPVTFGTNGGGFVGPYPVGFTPPLPQANPPSRAEYILK